jgi:hypothetical protein
MKETGNMGRAALSQDTAGEILPSPPLSKEGTETPPFAKGAAQDAGEFRSIVTHKEHSPAVS